jgi:large subunit ribosomal protein L32e
MNVVHGMNLRKVMKKGKPRFRRHESWRYMRLKENWRKPRGLDNKMRLEAKGWPKKVKVGYGGPRVARGLHPSGYEETLVHTPDEVTQVKPNYQAIRSARTVGTRKRIQITSLAREREIHVLNPLITRELADETTEEDVEGLGLEQKEAEQRTEHASNHRSGEEELNANES